MAAGELSCRAAKTGVLQSIQEFALASILI